MQSRYFNHLPLENHEVVELVKEAALSILERHGRSVVDDQGPMRLAQIDGFTFRHYRLVPDEIAGAAGTGSPNGEAMWDPDASYCIDVESSELLFGIAYDHVHVGVRKIVRGPWELGILKAAEMEDCFKVLVRLPPCAPESKSRWTWPLSALQRVSRRQLNHPTRFSIAGYVNCIHRQMPGGASLEDIAGEVYQAYLTSRVGDGHEVRSDDRTSAFGLWAWAGDRRIRLGKRMSRPDLAYWISPVGGCAAAAALLLLLDRDA